jgi:hypothetical protein
MEITVLEESWRRNGPVGASLEVIDDDDDEHSQPLDLINSTQTDRGTRRSCFILTHKQAETEAS